MAIEEKNVGETENVEIYDEFIDPKLANASPAEDYFEEDDDPAEDLYGNENVKFRKPRKHNAKKALIIAGSVAAALIAAALITFLILRSSPEKPAYDNTGSFYFSSDLLSEDGGDFTVFDRIEFDVRNYADELRVTEKPIDDYSVTVSSGGADVTDRCVILKEKSNFETGSADAGKVTVELPDELLNSPVDVTVTAFPENVVLKGGFTVVPSWTFTYSDEAGSVCGMLYLAANKEISVKVNWDPELVTADPTNPYIKASDEKNEATVTLAAGTGAEIYFFKKDVNADYSAEGSQAVAVALTGTSNASDGVKDGGFDESADPGETADTSGEIHVNPEN